MRICASASIAFCISPNRFSFLLLLFFFFSSFSFSVSHSSRPSFSHLSTFDNRDRRRGEIYFAPSLARPCTRPQHSSQSLFMKHSRSQNQMFADAPRRSTILRFLCTQTHIAVSHTSRTNARTADTDPAMRIVQVLIRKGLYAIIKFVQAVHEHTFTYTCNTRTHARSHAHIHTLHVHTHMGTRQN